jgi:hypothetical protein
LNWRVFFRLLFICSLGANMFSLYVLDKALFYRKQLGHIAAADENGVHLFLRRVGEKIKKQL